MPSVLTTAAVLRIMKSIEGNGADTVTDYEIFWGKLKKALTEGVPSPTKKVAPYSVEYADGYYIALNGVGFINFEEPEDLKFAQFVCDALNAATPPPGWGHCFTHEVNYDLKWGCPSCPEPRSLPRPDVSTRFGE